MKIATWNVNGIRARASQFHEWIEGERPDVVCLQELKAELSQVPEQDEGRTRTGGGDSTRTSS